MRKLFITCSCGQQMQVPRSAIGKMGQCPTCGEKIPITRETTSRTRPASVAKGSPNRSRWGSHGGPSIEAKQRFGRAVDLYCAGKYGEALVIFDALRQEFPDSLEIDKARQQCIEARNRDPLNLPGPAEGQVMGDELDDRTLQSMRRIVVEKMLHGESDAVQLQAAELVARMAGVLDGKQPVDNQDTGGSPIDGNADEKVAESRNAANGNGHPASIPESAPVDVDADEINR